MDTETERCPWCDSEITHEQFADITARIRQEEQARFLALKVQAECEATAKAEAAALKRVTAVETARDAAVAAAKKAAEEQLQRDQKVALKRVEAAESARDVAVAAQKASEVRLEAAVAAARKAAEEQLQKDQAAALKRVQAAESARDVAVAALKISDGKLEAAVVAAKKAAEEQLKKDYEQELKVQRESIEKAHEKDLLRINSENARERGAIQSQVRDLKRKLDNKTANEIGDGAQIDLFEELREAFPDDRITQIKKGLPGADIRHEVLHNGTVCGSILYDSKARQQWRNDYVTKLRDDQMADEANHAVLSSTVFPAGSKELCIESSVIVVSPSRAVYVATILRDALMRMRVLGLSAQQQESKTARLYEFITSNTCTESLTELASSNDALLRLDVDEKKAHDKVWSKRGQLLIKHGRQLQSFRSQLSSIVECTEFFDSDDDAELGPVAATAVAS